MPYKQTGYFIEDKLIWNELGKRGFMAKGFKLLLPDLRSASNDLKISFHEKINSLLRIIHHVSEDINIQIRWNTDSNYKKELLNYKADTDKLADNEFTKQTRNERFNRYWKKIEERQLKKEYCSIYFSIPIKKKNPGNLNETDELAFYDSILKQGDTVFESLHQKLLSVLGSENVEVIPMDDDSHFRDAFEYANPGYNNRSVVDPIKQLNPIKSIHENCFKNGFKGNAKRNEGAEYGYFMDGCYHDMLVIDRWGTGTLPCQFYELTSLDYLDYSITVNIYPKKVSKEKKELIAEIDRLETEMDSNRKNRVNAVSIATKDEKLRNMERGLSLPFQVHYVITAWDTKKEKLTEKINVLKSTIEMMGGASYYELANPATQKKFFHITWPGWIQNDYTAYRVPAENHYLCDFLPLSSTYTGMLENAEAIYDGSMFNLVGMQTFIDGTPQMCGCFGKTGSGKSGTIIDLLTQTDCYYDYTCIIEEGNSYGTFVQLMGDKSFIVNPSSSFTLNYFDTQGLPLTNIFISGASALVSKMCGDASNEGESRLRNAMLTHYIHQTYDDKFDYWKRTNEDKITEIAKVSLSVEKYAEKFMSDDSEFIERWVEFKELLSQKDDNAITIYDSIDDNEITSFIIGRKRELRDNAHAWYTKHDYPTHSELWMILTSNAADIHDEDEVNKIATLLNQWRANEGDAGQIFDGVSTIEITGKVAHFELGSIPKSAEYMKPVVAFLIQNVVRNYIFTLPRSTRKRIIFEEAGRFMDIPGGAEIISEGFAQLRKFNTWVLTVIQQYEKFKQSAIRATITGNCSQYILLQQTDKGDIDDMARDIYMPQSLRETLPLYPAPEKSGMGKGANFNCFTYWQTDTPTPKYGTIKNLMSKEMLYVSTTKGHEVEARKRTLKGENNILNIINETVGNKDKEILESVY